MVKSLAELFDRDLDRLIAEISSYKKESDLWLLPNGINNTGGNLCLHLAGNLQHFIGHVLGKTDYVRNRKAEFNDKNVLRSSLINEIEITKKAIANTLTSLTADQLNEDYPIELFGKPMTIGFFLIHLSGHLNYHLGQINYHRRLLS